MARAEALLGPSGPPTDGSKAPTTAEVREAIRRDARRLLVPLFKKIQQQRGLPEDAENIIVRSAVRD